MSGRWGQQVGGQAWAQLLQHGAFIERWRGGWQIKRCAHQQGQGLKLLVARLFKLGTQRLRLGQERLHLHQIQARGRTDRDAAR